jgi:hypothetical protein
LKSERSELQLIAKFSVIYQQKKALLEAWPISLSGVVEKGKISVRARCGHCMQNSWSWLWPMNRRSAHRSFVTKAHALDRQVRRNMIDKKHPSLSVGAQCRLLWISTPSFYYALMGETSTNHDLMVVIDKP